MMAREWLALTPVQYLKALRRYWWAVLLVLVLGGAGAGLVSALQTPLYRASVQLLFSPNFPQLDIAQLNNGSNYILQRTPSYAQIADSPEIAAGVIQRLGLPYTTQRLVAETTATTKAGTAVLDIAVVDPSPDRARDIANAIGDAFPGYIDRLETPTGLTTSPVKTSVVRPAVRPTAPDSPHTTTNVGLGLIGGLGIGAVAAIGRYARQRTVRDPAHAAAVTGTPLIGVLPVTPPAASDAELGTRAEALRQLRADIRLRAAGQPLTSITVTGAAAGDATTEVAAQLAIAFARAGETVVLVDGNLREPTVQQAFALPDAAGLADVLRGGSALAEATRQWRPELPLHLLPAGPPRGESSEALIRSAGVAGVLEAFRLGSVLAVIAAPTLLADVDALAYVDQTDVTVLVARVGVTPADRLAAVAAALRTKETSLLGVIAAN
ncbi:MAG TPA: Wzz/FepE/Etk N-terminal domain-containing protein [Rugosimonospora sp.]|nr:Wzz/FepE/Etk N-terminal domain-containing protein [Rugosimonospora sp.]